MKSYDKKANIKSISNKSSGILYQKGVIVQAHWKYDVLGRELKNGIETWTFPTKMDAREGFDDMRDRFNE